MDFTDIITGAAAASPKTPTEPPKTATGANTSTPPRKTLTEGVAGLQWEANKNRGQIEQHEKAEERFRNNSQKAYAYKAEILKGITAQDNIYTLFLKAAEAIALMTDDNYFYQQAEKATIAVYAEGLEEPPAIEAELAKVKARLEKLRAARQRVTDEGDRQRIETAIKFDERKEQELNAKL